MYALQNQVRAEFARELDAIERRKRSRLHDPRALQMLPRGLEKWERIARAEEAQRVVETVLREGLHAPDPRLDQWVERVYCMSAALMLPLLMGATIPLGPRDVITDGSIVGYLQGELGASTATGLSGLASQIGGTTLDVVQITGGQQPVYTVNDATLWGRATFTGDGSNDVMAATWDPPAPGTTALSFRLVAKHISRIATSAICFCGNAAIAIAFRDSTASPNVRCFNGITSGDVAMTLGTWYRVRAHYANSTSVDRLDVGSSSTGTGTAFGNNNGTSFQLFAAAAAGTSAGNYAIQKLLVRTAIPTSLESALLDGIDSRFYNGNVTL